MKERNHVEKRVVGSKRRDLAFERCPTFRTRWWCCLFARGWGLKLKEAVFTKGVAAGQRQRYASARLFVPISADRAPQEIVFVGHGGYLPKAQVVGTSRNSWVLRYFVCLSVCVCHFVVVFFFIGVE